MKFSVALAIALVGTLHVADTSEANRRSPTTSVKRRQNSARINAKREAAVQHQAARTKRVTGEPKNNAPRRMTTSGRTQTPVVRSANQRRPVRRTESPARAVSFARNELWEGVSARFPHPSGQDVVVTRGEGGNKGKFHVRVGVYDATVGPDGVVAGFHYPVTSGAHIVGPLLVTGRSITTGDVSVSRNGVVVAGNSIEFAGAQ